MCGRASQVVWSVLIDAVPTHGRNAQQITGAVTKQIKTYAKLLNEFTTTAKQEAALLVHVQARARIASAHSFPRVLSRVVIHGTVWYGHAPQHLTSVCVRVALCNTLCCTGLICNTRRLLLSR